MSVRDDLNKLKNLERVFNLTRWGKGIPGKQNGYPEGPDDLNAKGSWGETVEAEFKFENLKVWENENDGSKSLALRLRVATPGHSAFSDTCQINYYFSPAELENPADDRQARTKKSFKDLLEMMTFLEILPADKDWPTYTDLYEEIIAKWDQLHNRTVKASIYLSVYTNKQGEMKGPRASVNWWAKSDLDKKPEPVTGTDLPF